MVSRWATCGLPTLASDAKLALHAVDDDFQVQLAHAGDDGLARLFVGTHAEGRVFGGQTRQGDAHLFLVSLGLGFHGLGNHRLGKIIFSSMMWLSRSHSVTGGHFLQAHAGSDVAGAVSSIS